jgi:hypothetical protein
MMKVLLFLISTALYYMVLSSYIYSNKSSFYELTCHAFRLGLRCHSQDLSLQYSSDYVGVLYS